MKLAQMFAERFRDLDVNSRGKIFGHLLAREMQSAESFATRTDKVDDGDSLVYTFTDRSRLKLKNPKQTTDKATVHQLGSI